MIIAILLGVIIWLGIVALDAYLLATHVPTIIADPSNFGAWFWIVIVFVLVAGGASATSKS